MSRAAEYPDDERDIDGALGVAAGMSRKAGISALGVPVPDIDGLLLWLALGG